jgi:DNA polymerase-4
VVAAASYEARRFGVHSAMPMARAVRLCPQAVFLRPDHDRYARVSREIMALLGEVTPLVEPVSIDEAFLDVTGCRALLGDGRTIATALKGRLRERVGLTASVGVAANPFVAKVASDLEKPDGLVVVDPGGEAAFLAPLPVERLWGVGRVTARALDALGIRTIGQLAAVPPALLEARLGAAGRELAPLARGEDTRPVTPWTPPKSVGAEETFASDQRDLGRLAATLRQQAERVARELRRQGLSGGTVTLKLRFADFATITRSHATEPTHDGLRIYREARTLLERAGLPRPVRLIGVSVSGLSAAGLGQLPLLDPGALRRERLGAVVDEVARRFGETALGPASLLPPPGRRRSAPGAAPPRGPSRPEGPRH